MGGASEGVGEVVERAVAAGDVAAVQELVAGMMFADGLSGHLDGGLLVAAGDVEGLADGR